MSTFPRPFPVFLSLALFGLCDHAPAQSFPAKSKETPTLAEGFQNPPDSARPRTWWHWMNGNVTREGIKADLEDMKRVGLAGAQIFNVATREIAGPVPFGSPQWEDCTKYAMKTARDLGLDLAIMNGPGWSNSGGPWVTPEQSMKAVVWSETPAEGKVSCTLPQPPAKKDFYRDICVLAVPADPVTEGGTDPTSSEVGKTAAWTGGQPVTGEPWTFTFAYPAPTERASVILSIEPMPGVKYVGITGEVQVSQDGATFTSVHQFNLGGRTPWEPVTIAFPRTSARAFRLVVTIATPSSVAPKTVTAKISAAERIENFTSKAVAAGVASVAPLAPYSTDGAGAIPENQVIDLTARMKPDGAFQWDAPAGKWTILRLGYTTTDMTNHPAPASGLGLEVDKFSRSAIRQYLDQSLGRFLPGDQKLFTGILVDSWEVGRQNWTADFPGKFQQLRGYDLRAFLPALTGRVVSSPADTEAFLSDFRQTICDLVAHEYFGGISEFAKAKGLTFYGEAYDGYCFNEQQSIAEVDQIMTEFWARPGKDVGPRPQVSASVAHLEGKSVLASEAFTGAPEVGSWKGTLANLKQPGDIAMAQGVNRMVLHSYVHQPDSDLWPGFSLMFYGMNFGRLNPWWKEAGAWLDYLARCGFLLQQGRSEADFLLLRSSDVDMLVRNDFPKLPPGFAGDQIISQKLIKLSATNGHIVLPNGAGYRAIVAPKIWVASTGFLLHLEALVKSGLTLIGAPPIAPNNLKDQRALAAWTEVVGRLWPKGVRERDPVAAAKAAGWTPDCLLTPAKGSAPIWWSHRVDDARDIYFVTNSDLAPVKGTLKLRVKGRLPELWDAVTGQMSAAPAFRETADGTEIDLSLDALQSVFVVLQSPLPAHWTTAITGPDGATVPLQIQSVGHDALWAAQSGTYTFTTQTGQSATQSLTVPDPIAIGGPWNVHFQPPIRAGFDQTFDQLGLWNKDPSDDVKYFAGTGTYHKEITVPVGVLGQNIRAFLNLGQVNDVAVVTVNGAKAGTSWMAPHTLDVTALLKPGKNVLEIAVTDRAINRLIGDEQFPDDVGYDQDGKFTAFPDWYSDPAKRAARQRSTFTALRNWNKDTPLVDSGLAGPVTLSFLTKLDPLK